MAHIYARFVKFGCDDNLCDGFIDATAHNIAFVQLLAKVSVYIRMS